MTPEERRKQFLDYEISASVWASLIWFDWGQALAAKWFAWKTSRKYNRYLSVLNFAQNRKAL
jgi:hypothetical protein